MQQATLVLRYKRLESLPACAKALHSLQLWQAKRCATEDRRRCRKRSIVSHEFAMCHDSATLAPSAARWFAMPGNTRYAP
jgi:hypothetical protein